jgi:hypothetical protein
LNEFTNDLSPFVIAVSLLISGSTLLAQNAFVFHKATEFQFVGQRFKEAHQNQRLPMRYKDSVLEEL